MNSKAGKAAALTVAIAMIGAGAAFARAEDEVKLKIKPLENGKTQYKGKVVSDDQDCVERRKVKVSSSDQILMRTKTDGDGKYNETAKTAKTGTKLTLKVAPKGDDCPKLIGTGRAP